MKSFEEFSLKEVVQADSRAERVFISIGVNPLSDREKTMREICADHSIHPDMILDRIVDELYNYSFR